MTDASHTADFAAASERLFALLVGSIGNLPRETKLIVIPDRSLHFLPFAALRNGATKRFLVQDHELTYAPSATLLTTGFDKRESPISSRDSRVLTIGNPASDTVAFPLPRLPAAEREARAIAASYQRASTLVGSAATDTALAALAPTFDVVHFAGHAIVRSDAPQLSHLVLASDGRSDGATFASEIANWNLGRTRLVVLSGCSTSTGHLSATEGASSLARAFFAAGVHSVIASLWTIEDSATADFFIAFHRRLARGEQVATALRETQIEWIADPSRQSPSVWAAFQLFSR